MANVVLQLRALGIKDILGFDFIDKPPRRVILVINLLYSSYSDTSTVLDCVFQDGSCEVAGAVALARRVDRRFRIVRSGGPSDGQDSSGSSLLKGADFGQGLQLPGRDADSCCHAFGGIHLLHSPREDGKGDIIGASSSIIISLFSSK